MDLRSIARRGERRPAGVAEGQVVVQPGVPRCGGTPAGSTEKNEAGHMSRCGYIMANGYRDLCVSCKRGLVRAKAWLAGFRSELVGLESAGERDCDEAGVVAGYPRPAAHPPRCGGSRRQRSQRSA